MLYICYRYFIASYDFFLIVIEKGRGNALNVEK